MGSRRLPSPGFEHLSPQVGRGEGTRDCYRPTISGTLALGRDVASALGADDAVDDGHAGNHECQPPVPPTGHHIRLSDIAPDIVRIPWGKRGADVRPNFPKGKKGHRLSQRAPVRDPGPLGLMVSRGRGAVAGASIAPPTRWLDHREVDPSLGKFTIRSAKPHG